MARLYELIWKRMVASQMEAAEFQRTTIDIESAEGRTGLRATGSVLTFDGFLALYQEGRDDPSDEDDANRLPKVSAGDAMNVTEVKPEQHFTEPPPRFSEASLVKKLEELGIGRPSTYASILQVLRDRKYVRMEKSRFVPEDRGQLVTAFLTNFFGHYVEYDFTASLEDQLDQVSDGKLKWKKLLADFWRDFSAAIDDIGDLRITQVLDTLNEVLGPHIFPPTADGSDPRKCPQCGRGQLGLRLGKFGAFIGCSNYTAEGDEKCSYTRPLSAGEGNGAEETRTLGTDPDTGLAVTIRAGRFGPYLQLGETNKEKDAEKPKRASIPKNVDRATLTLEHALRLLSLPREIGLHPETGKPIVANFGRFGPYILHDGVYANLESDDEVFTIGLNRAVTVLAEKKANPRRRFNEPKALKELGEHPDSKAMVKVMSGRYGPYVTDGETNATLPKGSDPQATTLEQAVELLRARAEQGGGKKKKPAKARGAKAKTNGEAKVDAKPAKTEKPKAEAKEKPRPAVSAKKAAQPKKKELEQT
jgi:DNA topoisomerase-1